ncbi:MAG: FHA domain-containing protein [Planctomycetota bacterium]
MTNETMAKTSLVLVRKDGRTQVIPLKKERTIIGRHTGCEIRIPLAAVSRQHCELRIADGGAITARDLGSSNGTFVNKTRIDEGALAPGDVLAVGPVVFVLRVGDDPSTIDADQAWARGAPEGEGDESPAPAKPPAEGASHAPEPLLSGQNLSDESSVSDFDFDFLDDDEDDQPEL